VDLETGVVGRDSESRQATLGESHVAWRYGLCSNPGRASPVIMEPLILLVALIVIGTPIVAIVAMVRLHTLAEQLRAISGEKLTARLAALERQLGAIEKVVAGGVPASAPRTEPETLGPGAAPTQVVSPQPPVVAPAQLRIAAKPISTLPGIPKPHEIPGGKSPASVFAAPPLHAPQPKQGSSSDLETLIGARLLNRVAIVALIGAVSYFLKYAFDNNWIGPSGRVAIGVLIGALMLPWSQWLLRRGYPYFSEGIAGMGAAVMYISIWAGCQYYKLYSQDVGFFAMIVVTAGMTAVALGRNSQRIAVLSLVGGFLTPVLVSTGRDSQIVLFTYLLILGAGLLMIELRRDWRWLTPISFVSTQIYFWGWYDRFYTAEKLDRTLSYATLFLLLYAVVPILRAGKTSKADGMDVLLVLADSFAYFGGLYTMLWPQSRWTLTILVLLLSAGHLLIARLIPRSNPEGSPLLRFVFAGLALTFATLAIPIRLDGKWITLALALEGAVLVWTGFRAIVPALRGAGYLLMTISAFRLLAFPLPAQHFLFNERFGTYAVLIASIAAVLYIASKEESSASELERGFFGFLAVAINFFALLALSFELWDLFGWRYGQGINSGLAQHLSLSLLWTLYGSALIGFGIQRKSALLRWQALTLFGLVAFKVFLYDSSFLERFYRIVSFLILGLVLLAVSFLYQRKVAREKISL